MGSANLPDVLSVDEIAAVRKPLSAASLLPPSVYSSEALFRHEQVELFPRSWLPVCHVSQLPEAGSYVGRSVGGEPVLALKDKAGEIQVYSNVCRHRNATLTVGEGKCQGNRISCPYHGWTYGLDGRLLSAPFMDRAEGFDRKDYSLPAIRFEIWHGFVFVNLDGAAEPLGPQLRGLEMMTKVYDFDNAVALPLTEVEADWNWKVSLENFTEAYHQPWVHPVTAEASAPAKGARYYDNDGGAPWSAFLIPNAEEIEAFKMTSVARRDGPIAEDAPPIDIGEGALVFNIYPYFHALATPHGTLWLDFSIDTVDRHKLEWRILFAKDALGDKPDEAVDGARTFIGPVIKEDISICQRVGKGVRALKARPGRLSHMEKAVHQFHNWWLDGIGA